MMRILRLLIFFIATLFLQDVSYGQGSGPCDPDGICSSQQYNFPNATGQANVLAQYPSVDFGCLGYSPNAAWYYVQVDQSGVIKLNVKQTTGPNGTGSGLDVDFAMWGPYNNLNSACSGITGGNVPVQASYSTATTENIVLGASGGSNGSCIGSPSSIGSTSPPAAQAGEIYVIVITNYANTPGYISLSQTNAGQSGAGAMSCDIVVPSNCEITDLTATASCSGGNAIITGTISVEDVDIFTTGDLVVNSSCGGSQTFDMTSGAANNSGSAVLAPPNPGTAVLNYSLTVPGQGQDCYVNAVFTDDQNCNYNIQVTVPSCCTTGKPVITTQPADCDHDGVATISNYSSYTSGATFAFSPAGPTVGAGGVISGMAPGANYTVVATDNGCSSLISATFQIEEQLTVAEPQFNFIDGDCSNDGTTTLTNISDYGAGTTYVFTPNNPANPNPTGATIDVTTGVITGLIPGVEYTLVLTSAVGCNSDGSLVGILPQKPTPAKPIIATTAGDCSNPGSATITDYDNTYIYTFSPSGPTVSGGNITASAGTYTVTATNGDGCTSAASSFTIDAQATTPATPTVSTTTASCAAAGTATITNYVGTGVTYTFNPPGPSVGTGGVISNFNEDVNYTVTATSGSCTSSAASFNVDSQPGITPTPQITTTAASCTAPGASTITNYDANNTYTFTPAGPSVGTGGAISGTTPGTQYSVTSTATAGCASSAITFTDPAQLASITDPTVTTSAAGCTTPAGATITNYSTAITYTFNPTGPTVGTGGVISGLSAGSYQVTAEQNGCFSSDVSFVIDASMGLPTTPTVNTNPSSCTFNGSSTVTNYDATMTYNFSPSGPFVSAGGIINSATVGTTYTMTATDANGCVSSPSAAFTNQPMLPTPATPTVNVTPESCMSPAIGAITNYDNTLTYNFSPAGPSVDASGQVIGFAPGTNYTVTASNASGCMSTASGSFVMNQQLTTPNLSGSAIAGQNAYACLPSIGNYSVPNIPGATYTWNYSGEGDIIGNGNSITLDNITSGGALTVIATNSCGNSVPVTLSISVVPMELDVESTAVLCGTGGMGTATATPIGGNAPYVYQWDNGATTSSINNLTPGTYNVLVVDGTGCSASATVDVAQLTNIVIDINPSPATVLEGNSVTFNTSFSPYVPGSTYTWTPSESLSCSDCPNPVALPSDSTTYYLTITTPEGCVITDSVDVYVKINCGEDFIPNIFSPNDDTENDRFIVQGRCIEKMNMKIFNRWGNLVYETDDLEAGWDGVIKGKLANSDVYEYVITVTWFDETVNRYKGTVTLVR